MPVEYAIHFEQLGLRSGLHHIHLAIHLPEMQSLPRKFEGHTREASGLFLSNLRFEHIFSVRLDLRQVFRLDALE